MFIRLNYTKDFTVNNLKTYYPNPRWHVTKDCGHFDSRNVVGYEVIKDAHVYEKVLILQLLKLGGEAQKPHRQNPVNM